MDANPVRVDYGVFGAMEVGLSKLVLKQVWLGFYHDDKAYDRESGVNLTFHQTNPPSASGSVNRYFKNTPT